MKIELKNIRHSPSLSEETEAFTASLYINGTLAGYASNRGHGGSTDYHSKDEKGRALIKEAEAYCLTLPPEIIPAKDGLPAYSFDMNLESMIDNLLSGHLEQKNLQQFLKGMERKMESGFVVGIPDKSYVLLGLKFPIAMLLIHPDGTEKLQRILSEKVLPKLTDGKMLLNTNLPEKLLREAGLTDQHFQKERIALRAQKEKEDLKKAGKRFSKKR